MDEVDLAAYNHDVAYDEVHGAGLKGAVIDLETLPADEKLLSDAKQVLRKAISGKKDAITGEKISLMTQARARLVIKAFEPLIKEKKIIVEAADKIEYAKQKAENGVKGLKQILVNPHWRSFIRNSGACLASTYLIKR